MCFLPRQLRAVPLLLLALLSLSACANRTAPDDAAKKTAATRPSIVFMTDFGTANDAVAICKAVILEIVPDARIMDITHQVTPYSIEDGARFLASATPYYPPETIFLVVIDPGVGTSRKAVIVKSKKGQYFVLPDNGLITPVADRDGIEAAREITNPAWMRGDNISSTFHGRDVFSPAAAHLAAGEDWTLAGPEIRQLTRLSPRLPAIDKSGISGAVVALDDPYGSLITNISAADFSKLGYSLGDKVSLKIDKTFYTIPFLRTFMDVPVGEPLLYIDSRGRLSVALNERDFSKKHKITPPVPIFIPHKGQRP